jgi:hypothetical protein
MDAERRSKHWCRDSALAQIESCRFECEAGPLGNNEAWAWLAKALRIGPRFLPGQGVYVRVGAMVHGTTVSGWGHYYVVGVRMDSGPMSRFWVYDLSNDPPAPYHFGKVSMSGVKESKLHLQTETHVDPCERCGGTGAIDAPSSSDCPSCPDCSGTGERAALEEASDDSV